MKVKTIISGPLDTNCYLLKNEDIAIVVDPAVCEDEMVDFLSSATNKKLILLTHSHFDHIAGAKELRELTGAPIAVSEQDSKGTSDAFLNLSAPFGFSCPSFIADILLSEGQVLSYGNTQIKVMHTPGHTVGSVCFLIGDILISGDTLFNMSIGRTDFPGGDYGEILKSLKRLAALDDNLRVYSGHGDATTIGKEKRINPFLKGSIDEFM